MAPICVDGNVGILLTGCNNNKSGTKVLIEAFFRFN